MGPAAGWCGRLADGGLVWFTGDVVDVGLMWSIVWDVGLMLSTGGSGLGEVNRDGRRAGVVGWDELVFHIISV